MNPNDIRGMRVPFDLERSPPIFADHEIERLAQRHAQRLALLGITKAYTTSVGSTRDAGTSTVPQPVHTTAQSIESAEHKLADLKAKQKAEDKAAKEAEARRVEAEVAAAVREALRQRLEYERGLAFATSALLAAITDIELHKGTAGMITQFGTYRDELNPLAQTYGFKLVLVGDKTRAVLTR